MRRYRLSYRARTDLDDIWDYSVARWGRRQAADYLRDIQLTIQLIADRPELGAAHDIEGAQYRKSPAGSHVIFYRVGAVVEIIRVLHQNMDVRTHLL